jgi:hypothetical protein
MSSDSMTQLADAIGRYAGLSAAAQAAEVLNEIGAKLGGTTDLHMDELLLDLLPPDPDLPVPDQYLTDFNSLRDTIWQAFHALLLARLVYPDDQTDNRQGTNVYYPLGSEGRAALS